MPARRDRRGDLFRQAQSRFGTAGDRSTPLVRREMGSDGMLHWQPWATCTLAAVLVACSFSEPRGTPTVPIATESGLVRGERVEGVTVFRGIPYAKAPLGELRWRAPAPPEPWSDIRDATEFGPLCPQARQSWLDRRKRSEDCLTLNIWAGVGESNKRLPVMVWLHGGGHAMGGASLPSYDGAHLAARGVVVVTIQYRLGRLGFFAHPAVIEDARKRGEPFGNYGIMDQIAALQWVQRNITAFGGDPGNVTVFGQSAGARSVLWLMTSPAAAGLFHRAIVQSGRTPAPLWHATESRGKTPPASEADRRFVESQGLEPMLAALRKAPAGRFQVPPRELGGDFGPFIDGRVIADDPTVSFAQGRQHDVPLMIGTTDYESKVVLDLGAKPESMRSLLGDDYSRAKALYGLRDDPSDAAALLEAWEDAVYLSSARFLAAHMAGKHSPAYLYYFTYLPEFRQGKAGWPGVPHGYEIPFTFDNTDKGRSARHYNDRDAAIADLIADYWVAFAKTGNPNGASRPEWPAYDRQRDNWMMLSAAPHVESKLRTEFLDFHERRLRHAQRVEISRHE